MIPLTSLRRDGGTQPRDHISTDVAREYAEAMVDGASLPPVTVFYDGTDYWLADGFHRAMAHELLELDRIEADVRQGTKRDAVLHSVGANAAHGYRRTNMDKRRAVVTILNDPEWAAWSDREIARRCFVSTPLVGSLRPKPVTVNSDSDATRLYLDRHGNTSTMKVAAIGKPAAKPLPLVAGHVPDRRPDDRFGNSEEVLINEASRVTGINPPRLAKIARTGAIPGARKDGNSWAFQTDDLKGWMKSTPANDPAPPPSPEPPAEPGPPLHDPEEGRRMLAAVDAIEALVAGASAAELLAWWGRFLGEGFQPGTVDAARAWINDFAAGLPAAETNRQALIARLQEDCA
jgi:hypothetical protein